MTPFAPGSRPRPFHFRALALLGVITALVAGCASPTHRAPVEERTVRATRPAVVAVAPVAPPPSLPAPAAAPAATAPMPTGGAVAMPVSPSGAATEPAPTRPPPGIENLGKPGYYAVKPGDTLIRIGLESGQNWRDIVRWNNLDNANVIEVGQVLRVVPPGADVPSTAARPPVATVPGTAAAAPPAGVAAATPGSLPPAGGRLAGAASTPPVTGSGAPVAAPAPAPAAAPGPAASGDDDLNWTWPAAGPVLSGFDEARSKGLAIGGRAGDPVLAAADGRVVYAGSGLRGYGNLVIVKHNNTFLTAYAHNQTLLVKEDQNVRRGQRIAEMGSTDAERVQLHFEIRRQGRPVDPSRLLPAR